MPTNIQETAADVGVLFAAAEMIHEAGVAAGMPDPWTVVVNLETRKIGFLFETTTPLERWAQWLDVTLTRHESGYQDTRIVKHEFYAEMYDQPFYAVCTSVITRGGNVIQFREQM